MFSELHFWHLNNSVLSTMKTRNCKSPTDSFDSWLLTVTWAQVFVLKWKTFWWKDKKKMILQREGIKKSSLCCKLTLYSRWCNNREKYYLVETAHQCAAAEKRAEFIFNSHNVATQVSEYIELNFFSSRWKLFKRTCGALCRGLNFKKVEYICN